jgi:hypothetical protein
VRDEDGEWQIEEIIDSADTVIEVEARPSLALDSLGRPCISYRGTAIIDTTIRRLKYAVKKENGWYIDWVDVSEGPMGLSFLAFDISNNPHITYKREGWLKYAWKSNGAWHTEKIDSAWGSSIEATYTGLAMDNNGYAHISYNTQLRVDTQYLINTKYATGHPDVGIEVTPDGPSDISFEVYPSIGKREIRIEYTLDKKTLVNLSVYNIIGQRITQLVNEEIPCGKHMVYWNSRNTKSGIYFCRFRIGNGVSVTQKIVLIK